MDFSAYQCWNVTSTSYCCPVSQQTAFLKCMLLNESQQFPVCKLNLASLFNTEKPQHDIGCKRIKLRMWQAKHDCHTKQFHSLVKFQLGVTVKCQMNFPQQVVMHVGSNKFIDPCSRTNKRTDAAFFEQKVVRLCWLDVSGPHETDCVSMDNCIIRKLAVFRRSSYGWHAL